jgi:hypothetical protein
MRGDAEIGWIANGAIGFAGFANAAGAHRGAAIAHDALTGWLARQRRIDAAPRKAVRCVYDATAWSSNSLSAAPQSDDSFPTAATRREAESTHSSCFCPRAWARQSVPRRSCTCTHAPRTSRRTRDRCVDRLIAHALSLTEPPQHDYGGDNR